MLTIKFDRLNLKPGDLFLDAGTGFGRHAFEAARRGAKVVALDYAEQEVTSTRATFAAMYEAGELKAESFTGVVRGDATRLPFDDSTFDCIVTSEVLEHIHDDTSAINEFVRVLRPGGTLAATVPSWFPEKSIGRSLMNITHHLLKVGTFASIAAPNCAQKSRKQD